MKNVAILGASDNPNRYAHLAQVKLQEQGYFVYPISKSGKDILGVRGYTSLNEVTRVANPKSAVFPERR